MNLKTITLREWYAETFVQLFHADARSRTIEAYLSTIAVWERVTSNPAITSVDQFAAASFRTHCPGRAATISKHCRHLNHLFAKLGPSGPHNRDALGLVDSVPWFKSPRVEIGEPNVPDDAALEAFIMEARKPLALFCVLAATTGSRQTAIRLLSLNACECANQIIRFPSSTDKRGRARVKPVPAITVQWWNSVSERSWPASRSGFAAAWRKAAAAAGVPQLRPHGLKRWWGNRLIRAGASPWCVKFALDHSQSDVTGLHYVNSFDELATLVNEIELPPAFAERLNSSMKIEATA